MVCLLLTLYLQKKFCYYVGYKLPPGNERQSFLHNFKECENLYFPLVKFIQIREKFIPQYYELIYILTVYNKDIFCNLVANCLFPLVND